MKYPNVQLAYFIERPNRFIAHCRLMETNEEVITHVKNTGRGKEVFLPGAVVEQRFAHSKFDFLVETDADEQAFVEVKGMTLENKGIGAFPDAPTLRGLKHVTELMAATKAGYRCYILFVVQFEEIKQATIHQEMQPAFAENVGAAIDQGVQVLAYNCHVTPATIELKSQVTFDLLQAFDDPNK